LHSANCSTTNENIEEKKSNEKEKEAKELSVFKKNK